jgi:glucosyl-3-phosphoglycerate synthase
MADFHQAGAVATLHRLGTGNLDALEHELEMFARRRPIALVLPCLFAEFSRPAIRHIIDELRHVRYLDSVVVSLDAATAEDLPVAKHAFARLPQRVSFIWNDGPAVQALYALLGEHGLKVDQRGKGRACWIAYGYLLADRRCEVIAAHDCDITTYTRELLARLCYPVVNPDLGFDFAKGYYARVGDAMYGRVTRLLITPLVRSLRSIVGDLPFLAYLDSFRYALSGELAMRTELARMNRLPANWGLEVGTLAEVYRNCGPKRICQTELCSNYDHKHQPLSADDPGKGLLKMSLDIVEVLLCALAAEGVVFTEGVLKTLALHYVRAAEDTIGRYEADAAINSLSFDRHAEETMVAVFARSLAATCRRYWEGALQAPLMPAWDRVASAIPDFPGLLRDAVDEESVATIAA